MRRWEGVVGLAALSWPAISKLSWQLQTNICVTGSPWKPREGELEALWGIKPMGKALVWGWDCSTSPRKRLLTLEGEPKVPVPLRRPGCSLDAVCPGWRSGSPSLTWSSPREQWSEMWSSSSIPTDIPPANPINFISYLSLRSAHFSPFPLSPPQPPPSFSQSLGSRQQRWAPHGSLCVTWPQFMHFLVNFYKQRRENAFVEWSL